MSTPNPEQPEPTPRTDENVLLFCSKVTGGQIVLADFARQLERELNAAKANAIYWKNNSDAFALAAKQPVPDAGMRKEIKRTITAYACDPSEGLEHTVDRILALLPLPAPTPATSEDTLMLDWLEQHDWSEIFGDEVLYTLIHLRHFHGENYDTLRQALRAAMAHAGEQKT